MKAKSVLAIAAVAMLALAIGQVRAESIYVPGGDIVIYKPGTGYTVTAVFGPLPNSYASGFGDNITLLDGNVTYSDATTGTTVDCPGWIAPYQWIPGTDTATANIFGTGYGYVEGTTGFQAFAGWSGGRGTLAESSDSLGIIGEGASYTLSAMCNGAAGPMYFELLAGGVAMPPSSSVNPVSAIWNGTDWVVTGTDGWEVISRTYDAEDIAAHIGESITILMGCMSLVPEPGVGDYYGAVVEYDHITLDGDNLWNPSPGDGKIIEVDANLELNWNNRPPVDSNDVYVDVWFGTEPNELHPAYDMTLIVDAGKNADTVIVDASVEDTYYWQVNSYVYGAANINDSNMIEGDLWIFYAVDDLAPAVEIVTLDKMTWSGEGVPLDATVTDDDVSAVTVEWSADIPTGISAAFDPGNDVADTTVTLTKIPYSEARIANPGFEDPVLVADDDWSYSMDNQGWGYFANDGYLGSWNITTADYPGEAPEGQNVGWAEPGGVPGGFAQVLTETLAADTTYTLTVEVGNALTYAWGGYKVQLLAGGTPQATGDGSSYTGAVTGGTLLAEDNNLLTIAAGTFQTSTVVFDSTGVDESLLGEPLQIRLLALAASEEVEFDNVRLTADPPSFIPTGVQTVTMTLAATDGGNPTPGIDGTASIEIDVYDDACHLARVGEGKSAVTDFNVNCITGLGDLVVMVEAWLDNYASTGPVVRP